MPFSSKGIAVQQAKTEAEENASNQGDIQEEQLTPRMLQEGWVLSLKYSIEDDYVRVVERTMDQWG